MRRVLGVSLLAAVVGCASRDAAPPALESGQDRPRYASEAPEKAPQGRVGNHDPRGSQNQPDWDLLAAQLRHTVAKRLPQPLPEDHEVVCREMLDEAQAFYAAIEGDSHHRRQRKIELEATRADDERACLEELSIEAALCVTIRLRDRNAEFPWLVDQCSRAFPDAGGPPAVSSVADPSEGPASTLDIAFVGDVIFGRYRGDTFDPIPVDGIDPFEEVRALLRADLTVANLETPVVETLAEKSPIGSKFRFGASREHVKLLRGAGIDVVSLANNHYFDLREQGQRESPRILGEEGVQAIGASREEEPAVRIETVHQQGWKIAFVAVTNRRNAPARPGQPILPYMALRDMAKEIPAKLAEQQGEHQLVVVFVHWGDEYADEPHAAQQRVARALIDGGVDVVVGHHPHVLQGVERYKQGLIAYSLGNFLFENANKVPRLTGVLKLRFAGGNVPCRETVTFSPAYIKRGKVPHPVPATGGMQTRVFRRLDELSRRLGSSWTRDTQRGLFVLDDGRSCGADGPAP